MPVAQIEGGDIHYEESGVGAVLAMLLPQSGGPVGVRPFHDRLAERFRVVRYDQRGTGRSAPVAVNGGGIMLHARRPGGPVAAAQNCAIHGPLSVATRGRRCTAWSSMTAVRLAVVDEGLSHHEAGRRFGIDRRTVKKMLSYSAPPGYRRTKPVRRPKLDGFTGIVDAILEADTDPDVPRKQRHTAHRIFERLRDEHGFTGGYTIQTV